MYNYSVQNILNIFQKQEELYLERITQKEKQCRDYIKSYVNYNGLDPIDQKHKEFIEKYRLDNSYIHFKKKDERLRKLAEISEVSNTWKPPKEFFEWFKESKYITEEYVLSHADENGFYLNEDLATFRKMGAMDTDIAILSRIPIVMPYRKRGILKKEKISVDQYNQIKDTTSLDELLNLSIVKNPREFNISKFAILEVEAYTHEANRLIKLSEKRKTKLKVKFSDTKDSILNIFTTKETKDYKKPKFNNIRRVIERYPIVYEKLLWEIEHYDKYDDLRDIIYEGWYIGQSSFYIDDRDSIAKTRNRQIEIIKDIINQNNVFDLPGFLNFLWSLSDEEVLILTQNGNEHTGFNIFSNLFLKDWNKDDKMKEGVKSAFVLNAIQWIQSKDMPFIRIYQSYTEGASMQSTDFFILKSRIPSPVQLHAALSLSEGQDHFKSLMKEIKTQCDLFYHHDSMDRFEEVDSVSEELLNFLRKHEWILGEPLVLYNDENDKDTPFMIGGKYRFAMGSSKVQDALRKDMYKLPFDERLILDFLKQFDPDFKLKHGDYPNVEKIKSQYWDYTNEDLKLIKENDKESSITARVNLGSIVQHLSDKAILSYNHDYLREKSSADKHFLLKYSHNQIKGGVTIAIKGALKIAVNEDLNDIKKRWYILLQQFILIKEEWNDLISEITLSVNPDPESKKATLNKRELNEYIKLLRIKSIEGVGVSKEKINELIEYSLNKLKEKWQSSVISTDNLNNSTVEQIVKDLYEHIEYFMQNIIVYKNNNDEKYSDMYYDDIILIKFLKLTEFNILGFVNRHIRYSSGYKDLSLSEIPKSYYAHHLKSRDHYCFVSAPVYYGLRVKARKRIHYNEYFKLLFDIKSDEFIMPAKVLNSRDRKSKINKYLDVIKGYQKEYLQMLKDINQAGKDIISFKDLPDDKKEKFPDWLSKKELDSTGMEYNAFYILSLIHKNRIKNYKKLNNNYRYELSNNPRLSRIYNTLIDMETYEYDQFKVLKGSRTREEHDIVANYDEEEMKRVGRNWEDESNAHKKSVKDKVKNIKEDKRIPEELISKWLNQVFFKNKIAAHDLNYNRMSSARESNQHKLTKFELFFGGMYDYNIDGTNAYEFGNNLRYLYAQCMNRKEEFTRKVRDSIHPEFSDQYQKDAQNIIEKNEVFYKDKCKKEVTHYLNNTRDKIIQWIFSEEQNNYRKYERIQRFYDDRKDYHRSVRGYISEIIEFLQANDKLSVVIDTVRIFGAAQDEFNDPRYKDRRDISKSILTIQPVGRSIDCVKINQYVGINLI